MNKEEDANSPLLSEQSKVSPKYSNTSLDSKQDLENKSDDIMISIPDSKNRFIACMQHGDLKDYCTTVFFLPGAGFGRTNNPDFNNTLIKNKIRLIIIDRPGYGKSTFHEKRTYQTFALDLYHVLKYFKLHESKSYFIAHSAGCPHLLAFCIQYPDNVAKAAIVCPPNPLIGKAPIDRPNEPTCTRSCQRCCVLNMLCCFSCCVNPMLTKWQNDPKEFEKFTFNNLTISEEINFYKQYPEQRALFVKQFGDAVHPPDGQKTLYQDMFELPTGNWGFLIKSIKCNVDVWYGNKDEVTPNGQWFAKTIPNAKGYEENGYGHGLLYVKFDKIIEKLIELSKN